MSDWADYGCDDGQRARWEEIAGQAKLDPNRPRRIGQMQGSSDPRARAYARRIIAYMSPEDREAAGHAYREIPATMRGDLEARDRDRAPQADFGPLDAGEHRSRLSKRRGATDEGGRMVDIRAGSPYALSAYLARWVAKRGPDPLEAGDHERIHAEIVAEIRAEAAR